MAVEGQKVSEKVAKLDGKTVVFSGFRDEALKVAIERRGGKVVGSLSGKTSLLVYVKTVRNAKKVESATCPTMPLERFLKTYGLKKKRDDPVEAREPVVKAGPHTFALRLHAKVAVPFEVPKWGESAVIVGDNAVVIDGVAVSPVKLWSQVRHMVHSMYDKKITETKEVVKALYYHPRSGRFAVALYHKSEVAVREWDLSYVVFDYWPAKNPQSPHHASCYSFAPHTLIPVARKVKKTVYPVGAAEIPKLHGARALGFVHLLEYPKWV